MPLRRPRASRALAAPWAGMELGLQILPQIIVDGLSMGLAPILVEQILATVGDLNKAGVTILLVEQNALRALTVAHRG